MSLHLNLEFWTSNPLNSEDEDAKSAVEVVPSIGLTLKAIAIAQFEAAISPLSQEVSKLPTGRVSAGMLLQALNSFMRPLTHYLFSCLMTLPFVKLLGMLDNIIVETGGLKMPLRRVAVVSVIDSRTLSITPYDPKVMKNIPYPNLCFLSYIVANCPFSLLSPQICQWLNNLVNNSYSL